MSIHLEIRNVRYIPNLGEISILQRDGYYTLAA